MKNFDYIRLTIAIVCLAVSSIIVLFILYKNSQYSAQLRPFSSYTLLSSAWDNYKQQYINNDGRVVDFSQNSVTTSEGQSYALLRAVWIDDKATFDKVWNWTKINLRSNNAPLFGWQWGKESNGRYGLLPNGGNNTAADADSDIALALILASRRWNQAEYKNEAKKILSQMWSVETAQAGGKRYLIAGNWAKSKTDLVINPSYFAPYAWAIFAQVDTQHDWKSLITPAYELLSTTGKDKLDTSTAVGLPPDWVSITIKDGIIKPATFTAASTDYSYDAIRVPWRIALDYQWNKNPQAKEYLLSSFSPLANYFKEHGVLPAAFSHDGGVIDEKEYPTMYATALGYFLITDPKTAQKVYQQKILGLYSNDTNSFNKELPYYEQNWLWFAVGLYNKALISY